MTFLVIVKVSLAQQYEHWRMRFDADAPNREAGGVHCVFRHPVIGEQAVVFGMRTAQPRLIHDMMYAPQMRPAIEESGLVLGSEEILICDEDDQGGNGA